ncbi:hypothetical protein DID78_04180 [Candidatus Marinamargulisbacteria bacterium SCGC AG-343-D04]|nr:hypothetical protein DID78_04180 [Candidatus Marinamargulisbacteria bacterium SCGC AG-343-D04]
MTKVLTKEENIWSCTSQPYDFFSVFLERHVLNIEHLDLSFIPNEYLDLITQTHLTPDGDGYLNLLTMLFTEYYQEKRTGFHKISLPDTKYIEMSKQFQLYCECEKIRRKGDISYLSQDHLFDPNFKTVIHVNPIKNIESLKPVLKSLNITLKEFKES